MAQPRLAIAFWWHHHQPDYKSEGEFVLPWVRFHGTKDYLDFAHILKNFPQIRCTINITPCLVDQIIEYVQKSTIDLIQRLTLIPARDLTRDNQIQILKLFFFSNYKTQIEKLPRYRHLYEKRGFHWELNPDVILRRFTEVDWRDLQILYNLAWVGPVSRNQEPFLSLIQKGKNYSEEDKLILFQATKQIMAEIIPLYKKLYDSEQVELTTSPFYHPILPLLIDSESAIRSNPKLKGIIPIFSIPEDAKAHIRTGINLFQKHFGASPSGMWPPEGSVSEEALSIYQKSGISFLGTDEGILKRSFGNSYSEISKYKLWKWEKEQSISLLFRDHFLSDRIGFVYSQWDPVEAVNDFMGHLVHIRETIIRQGKAVEKHIIPVILDGENCWEYYPENGYPFLNHLYQTLSDHDLFYTTRISDFLKTSPEINLLKQLTPGSWIQDNFDIWIGHQEDQEAWRKLIRTRSDIFNSDGWDSLPESKKQAVAKELLIAEGSDWFWWYGDEHYSSQSNVFDDLFRYHLQKSYMIANQTPPPDLYEPIRKTEKRKRRVINPTSFISPRIDGASKSYFEWLGSGSISVTEYSAMHGGSFFLKNLRYGFDPKNFYLKFEPVDPSTLEGTTVRILLKDEPLRMNEIEFSNIVRGRLQNTTVGTYFLENELEISIPLNRINPNYLTILDLRIEIRSGENIWVQIPLDGFLTIDLSWIQRIEQDWSV